MIGIGLNLNGGSRVSPATGSPANTAAPVATSSATFSAPMVGDVLQCARGTWTGGGLHFAYQWKNGSDDSNAAGAGNATPRYVVNAADDDDTLYCHVTATNTLGSSSHDSNESGVVTVPVAAPVFSVNPVATSNGDLANPVVGDTFSSTSGTASGSPTFAYQWRHVSDNSNATGTGAATNTYVANASDEGEACYCHVTATNAGGSATANSNASGIVSIAPEPVLPVTSGLILDLNPNASSAVNGDRVAALVDQSSALNDFAQSDSTAYPTLHGGARNGKKALTFDGVNDYLSGNGLTSAQMSIYLVLRPNSTTATDQILIQWEITSNGQNRLHFWMNASSKLSCYFCDSANSAVEALQPGAVSTDWQIASAVFSATPTFYKNGSAGSAASCNGTLRNSTSKLGLGTKVNSSGVNVPGESQYLAMDVARLLIYDNTHSGATRQSMEAYLGKIYDIEGAWITVVNRCDSATLTSDSTARTCDAL